MTDPVSGQRYHRLAIVIPTLDEEDQLAARLRRLIDLADEVIVADGGSRDGTRRLAERLGARVVTSEPGRGAQLNAGTAATDAEILLFLHADTDLAPESIEALHRAVDKGACGGGFLCRFDQTRPIYRLGESLVNLRTRLTRAPLGDQAQFATAAAFAGIGGFRKWPLLEDLDFIRRLKRHGRVAVLGPPAVTSARRYEEKGIARTIATNWLIFALFFLGVSPHRLRALYR